MIFREISGTRLPALGFGTFQLTGDLARSQVGEALKAGYRLIDTARLYGNEKEVGDAISNSGIKRSEIFVTSKIWIDHLGAADLRRETDNSLSDLKTEYLDLLLIHWPNPAIPLEESLAAMQQLIQEGKVRHLGVSNFPPSLFERACDLAPVFTNQVEYHPLLGQDRLLRSARERGVGITAYCPLGQGVAIREAKIVEIGKRRSKTAAQVTLRWLLQQEGVVAIPRSSNPERLRSNFEVFDFELSPAEMAEIDALPKDRRQCNPSIAPDWEE